MKRWIARTVIASLIVTACGCGGKEPPPDTPWNRGYYAIMETEQGYYSNLVGEQSLRYYEKETGREIYLCPKPECVHDGDETCVATYNNMKVINSVLYDGAIYILTVEKEGNVVSFNLYRTTQDGSSLDKVGEVFSAQNFSDMPDYVGRSGYYSEPEPFIIHRGYAYIPIFLSFGYSLKGFVNGGIIKMDLRTGQTEQICKVEKLTSPDPTKLWGCGDYVYYDMHGTYRYNIMDGGEECVYTLLWPDGKGKDNYHVACATEDDVFYNIVRDEEKGVGIGRSEKKNEETVQEILFWLEEDDGSDVTLCLYEDKLFLYGENAVSVYDLDGKRLGKLVYDLPEIGVVTYRADFPPLALNISEGRLYASWQNPNFQSNRQQAPWDTVDWIYKCFSCSIEEIIEGTGKWEPVYTAKNLRPKYMQGGNVLYELYDLVEPTEDGY